MRAARHSAPGGEDDHSDWFDCFYLSTVRQTFRAACHTARGDIDVAHDATQEAYMTVLRIRVDGRRQIEDPARYVIGIAVNKVVDFYRLRGRHEAWNDDCDASYEDAGFDRVDSGTVVEDLVMNFLNRQPLRRRAVGVLFFMKEFTYAEISDFLDGMSQSTARTHVQRLRADLIPLVKRITDGGEHR